MIWHEITRPGAIRAFHVTWPEELDAQHWFELQPVDNATVLRHIIDGRAFGAYMSIWTDKIEPRHNVILEALLDNVEAVIAWNGAPGCPCATGPGEPGVRQPSDDDGLLGGTSSQ